MTTIYVAIDDSLLVVRAHEGGWRSERQLAGTPTQCLAADPLRPELVYCGSFGQGLFRSLDAGASWVPVGDGIAYTELMALAVSPSERVNGEGVVYAGTEPSALFRSADGGASWQELTALQELPSKAIWSYPPRPYTHHVRCIGCDPHDPALLIVCLENGALVRSLDGGISFHDRTPDGPRDTHTLALHRLAPGRVYSAAGDGFNTPGSGYCESGDGGASWQRPDDGLEWHYGWGLAVDATDPDLRLVSMAQSPDQAHNPARASSTIYRRAGDEPWQEAIGGLPGPNGMLASHLAAHPEQPGCFFAANNRGLFRSADGGRSWEALPIPWPEYYRWRHVQALLVTV